MLYAYNIAAIIIKQIINIVIIYKWYVHTMYFIHICITHLYIYM